MANMSYCRFQNTNLDLDDCWERIQEGNLGNLSEEEQSALKELVFLCEQISEHFETYGIDEQLEETDGGDE